MNRVKIVRSASRCKRVYSAALGGAAVRGRTIAAIVLIALLQAPGPIAAPLRAAPPRDVPAWLDQNLASLVELYQQFHQAPELSLQEEETAARLADQLRDAGATVTTGVGGTGVVGVLENGPGNTLLIRADLDALPVAERTGLPYASQVRSKNRRGATVGVMHACGHDIHMTNLVGVARYLASRRDQWSGTVVFLGQPAEEIGAGAKAMLADGLLARFPRPDFALALHVAAEMPTGQVAYCPGYAQANVDSVDITIQGRGGHGAYPETTIDPIVIAARLVLDLQTIVSREIKATDPAVITVGSIQGGTKHNVIGDQCRLQLTVRSYSPEVRRHLLAAIERKAQAAAAAADAPPPEIDISEGTPALYNDPELTATAVEAIGRAIGRENVVTGEPSMGGEDFGRYGRAGVPICMFKLGSVSPQRLDEFSDRGQPPPSLHSPQYWPDAEATLGTGVPAMVAVALELLGRPDAPSDPR